MIQINEIKIFVTCVIAKLSSPCLHYDTSGGGLLTINKCTPTPPVQKVWESQNFAHAQSEKCFLHCKERPDHAFNMS